VKLRWMYLFAALFLAAGAWLGAACGGGGDKAKEEAEEPAAVATVEDEETAATDEAADQGETSTTKPAAAFAELESYRYSIKLSLEGAAGVEGGEALGLQGALAFNVEGAFVAPDRNHVKVSGNLGGLELNEETIAVGSQSWVRSDGDWAEGEASFSTSDFSPASFLEDFDASDISAVKPTKETVNGVRSLRYKISREDIETIGQLGALFGGDGGLSDLPENFDISLWLAEDGKWPVRLVMSASGVVEGNDMSFEMSMDVTDVNDKDIEIEPPT